MHKGHLLLIDFAKLHCDSLTVLVCSTKSELFAGETRKQWILEETQASVQVKLFEYDSEILPNTSISSKEVSKLWAEEFKRLLPETDIIFTSEQYGEYLAEFMNISHMMFDVGRTLMPVSASAILSSPFEQWNFIPKSVRPFFVKKICIIGTESTGKSTLCEKLAFYFTTTYVAEAGRDIVPVSSKCTWDDLELIGKTHAMEIKAKAAEANKLLFIDTDIKTTQSYSVFLFNRPLVVDDWIEKENKCDLYLFLEPDCEFVQDGTRLSFEERNKLHQSHLDQYSNKGLQLIFISGSWQNRFETAITVIEKTFF